MEPMPTYTIPFRGLKNGRYDYRFAIGRELFAAYPDSEIRGGACEAEVVMERAETQLVLDVAIRGHVVVPCDRCLEDCDIPVDFAGRLVVRISDEQGEYDGEQLWVSPADEEVDLMQYLYESVVLSLPYQRVHPEGQCDPAMMARFTIVSGEEFARIEADADEAGRSIGEEGLSRLAELKARMEEER